MSLIALPALCKRCITAITARHKLPADQVKLEVPPDAELWTDAPALEIILKNLLDNAIKYSDPPVDVRVLVTVSDKGRVRIDVVDKGVGIPRAFIGRIFDRFYRVDEEAVRARRGHRARDCSWSRRW